MKFYDTVRYINNPAGKHHYFMAIQSRVFSKSKNTPKSVLKNPHRFMEIRRSPIPVAVMSLSFVYYLLSINFRNIELSYDFLEESPPKRNYSRPYVILDHVKSRKSKDLYAETIRVNVWYPLSIHQSEIKKINEKIMSVLKTKLCLVKEMKRVRCNTCDVIGLKHTVFQGQLKTTVYDVSD